MRLCPEKATDLCLSKRFIISLIFVVHASEEETAPNVRPKLVFLFPLLGNFLCLSEGYFFALQGRWRHQAKPAAENTLVKRSLKRKIFRRMSHASCPVLRMQAKPPTLQNNIRGRQRSEERRVKNLTHSVGGADFRAAPLKENKTGHMTTKMQ